MENENTESQEAEIPEAKEIDKEFMPFLTRMCSAHNWVIREIDDEHAVIEFSVDKTRTQTLFIFSFEDYLEFSVPSFAAFDAPENIPHILSTSLLQINAKTKIGFWCVEKIGEKSVFTFMHNASLAQLNETLFGEIVTTLIQRVEEFENLLMRMSSENKPGNEVTQ